MRLMNFSPAAADAGDLWQDYLKQPQLYPRSEEFSNLIHDVTECLRNLCHTDAKVLLLTAAGTGALECAIAGLPEKSRIMVIRNGYFGNRLYEIARFHFPNVFFFDLPFGVPFNQEHEVRFRTEAEKNRVNVIVCTHLETASTVLNDVSLVGRLGRQLGAVTVVDGISSVGSVECKLKEWGLNCFVASSYKALMCPAGLSFIIANDEYLSKTSGQWSYYFDLSRLKATAEANQYLWSPSVLSLYYLRGVIDNILTTGQDRYFGKLKEKARAFRDALLSSGFSVFGDPNWLSPCFTSIKLQSGNASKWLAQLKENHKIVVGKGLGEAPEDFLRIGHYPNRNMQEFELLTRALAETSVEIKAQE